MTLEVIIPAVPRQEIAAFGRLKATMGRLYNRVRAWPFVKPIMLMIGPFFRAVATKPATATAQR
jgi:hypothetical protein